MSFYSTRRLLCILLVGTMFVPVLLACRNSEIQDVAQYSDVQETISQNMEVEKDLAEYAKKHTPKLQKLIDDLSSEIGQRNQRIEMLGIELKRLGEDVDDEGQVSDKDFIRWSNLITEMKSLLNNLRQQRKDTYLAYRKIELIDGDKEDLEKQIEGAEQKAEESRKAFGELLKKFDKK